ncbi:MAG: uracil-DNA glycosylase [Pseudomonadota bacterium]
MHHKAAAAALQFYLDNGVDTVLQDKPVDRTKLLKTVETPAVPNAQKAENPQKPQKSAVMQAAAASPAPLLGKSDARNEAVKLAQSAKSLDDLREAIANFDGIAIKKTATNLVFCDGNPKSPIMLVGEAPGADEDRQGKPFVGVSGQLLDKIFACIDLDRAQEDSAQSVYISNILNWRPPGNRTPNPAEIEVSLPFIERHIQLIQPKLLIFCGGVAAKSLLGSGDSISRLRKNWHDYMPQTPELAEGASPIPAIATYHPAYLLRTPAQKKAVWADMLSVQQKRKDLGLI